MRDTYLYFHGFASSPSSVKAQLLCDRIQSCGQCFLLPDLNQGDFAHLTLTRQIQQGQSLLRSLDPNTPVTVIGSSFGGLTAAWLAECQPQIQRLVLLAPAFEFLQHWLQKLGTDQVQQWQTAGQMPVYHYGEQQWLPLHYEFVVDAQQYDERQIQRSLPTLILHGRQDEVIPVQSSRSYAASRPWVQLVELESDHGLVNVMAEIWAAIQVFCHSDLSPRDGTPAP